MGAGAGLGADRNGLETKLNRDRREDECGTAWEEKMADSQLWDWNGSGKGNSEEAGRRRKGEESRDGDDDR
jgi:hypothetical protein